MTLTYFTVATLNAKNLISPGVRYYGNKKYSQRAYDQKLEWLATQLLRMDADFVAVQEVFEPEPLQQLADLYTEKLAEEFTPTKATRDAFNHVWHTANEGGGGGLQPGLGFLSRRAIRQRDVIQELPEPIEVHDDGLGLTYRLERTSRPIQAALVDLGRDVDGWIFNAHLKSKRPRIPANSPAQDEENFEFLERTAGAFRSQVLRAGEALALRREILDRLEGTNTPVIVAGDLNDEIGAVTTEMVSGEVPWRGWNRDTKAGYWDVELYSAARSHLRRSEHASLYTHIYNGHYGTIDHILVSQEFYYRNRDRIGDIHFVQAFNDHLTDDSQPGAPSLGPASDHGQLAVRLSIDPDRL